MAWLSAIGTTFYYLSLPLATIVSWLLVILAPVIYLGRFMAAAFLLPLKLLARLETLYIYFGAAAVIGLAFGAILHASSSLLVSVFNLASVPEKRGPTAASVRAVREKNLQQAWRSSTIKSDRSGARRDGTIDRYAEWLENQRREDQGLLGLTILEEDDSEEAF